MAKERIILKISGAALKESKNAHILSSLKLQSIATQIKIIHQKYDIGIVVGAGNIWRGGTSDLKLYREEQAHYMGMVATIINSVALKEALLKNGIKAEVHSLLSCPKVAINYHKATANKALDQHKVIILAGGTGKPFFSTDTGAAKDAIELNAQYILMGKDGVDGVYSDDPKQNKNVIRYSRLTFKTAIDKKLKVMDLSAMKLCQKNNITLVVFNMLRKNAITNAINRKIPITIISNIEGP
ncbi:MAG: UMP kinase [Mycoplasmataceae bacterium]|jgi:uridylate kinase|nr:UMP kinase [Mycoplasmataceae bacterium]